MDNALYQHSYRFRVSAFNEFGGSGYSNEDTVSVLPMLFWLAIDAPNGGEIWAQGSSQQIMWRSSTIFPPSRITIEYSLDGGSNWLFLPIADNIANTGAYSWMVPQTPSENCIIKIKDAADGSPYDLSNAAFTIGPFTAVDAAREQISPAEYALHQNYPNPFNPVTTIAYSLPKSCSVSLILFNFAGREISVLVQGEQPAGEYEVQWQAGSLPSGIYICRLQAGDYRAVRKLVLLR